MKAIDIRRDGHILYDACKKGNRKLAKMIINNIDCGLDNRYQYALHMACFLEKISFVKMLVSWFPQIDIHADDEYAFRTACKCASFEFVKKIHMTYPETDVHAHNYDAMISICARQNYGLEMLKWICNIDPDIEPDALYKALVRVCWQSRNVHIVTWLLEYPSLNIFKNDHAVFIKLAIENIDSVILDSFVCKTMPSVVVYYLKFSNASIVSRYPIPGLQEVAFDKSHIDNIKDFEDIDDQVRYSIIENMHVFTIGPTDIETNMIATEILNRNKRY